MADQITVRMGALEEQCNVFPDHVVQAAYAGHLNSGPLISQLERAIAVSRGLSTIFTIARNNAAFEMARDDAAADEHIQAPLSANTIESLFVLGEAAAEMLTTDIERTSNWAQEHGVLEGGK